MPQPEIYSPIIAFLLTILVEGVLILRLNIRYIATVSRIQRLCSKEGKQWDYWCNVKLRLAMFRNADAIFEPADSTAVRSAKEDLVRLRLTMSKSVPICVAILAAGFVVCIVCAIVEYYISGS